MKHRHLFLAFIPAILVVLLAVGIRLLQFNTLVAANQKPELEDSVLQIPIFPADHIVGDPRAPITLVAFEDLGCSGCSAQNDLFNQLLAQHPDKVKIIWKPLSVNTIPFPTRLAHEYAFCADEQGKFADFKNRAFANHLNLSPEILVNISKQIDLDLEALDACIGSGRPAAHALLNEQLAQALNIQSVPLIFMDNVQIESPSTVSGWETLLQL